MFIKFKDTDGRTHITPLTSVVDIVTTNGESVVIVLANDQTFVVDVPLEEVKLSIGMQQYITDLTSTDKAQPVSKMQGFGKESTEEEKLQFDWKLMIFNLKNTDYTCVRLKGPRDFKETCRITKIDPDCVTLFSGNGIIDLRKDEVRSVGIISDNSYMEAVYLERGEIVRYVFMIPE